MRVVASIEARMGSSRLPGKVLADIGGMTTLDRLVTRLEACETLDAIILATSVASADDALEDWAQQRKLPVFRGSEEDVLDRVVRAHAMMQSDLVVEVTGDCPLLDPGVIDLGVETFLNNDCDVVTNCRVPSYPQGADIQVFRTADLADVARSVGDPAVREHVSLFFYENTDKYRIIHLIAPKIMRDPELRLQLDYAEDLAFIRAVYEKLEHRLGAVFGVEAVIRLLEDFPELRDLNSECIEKPVR